MPYNKQTYIKSVAKLGFQLLRYEINDLVIILFKAV